MMRINFVTDFFRDIANFFRSGSVLGIDIGTSAIKAVEVFKKGDALRLQNYAILETKSYLERQNRVIQTSSLKISENDGAYLLGALLREMKPSAGIAVASLPAFASFITVLEMPLLSKTETDRAVAFQARQFIPIDVQQVYIEWFRIEEFQDEGGNKSQRIMLLGIPKDIIARYKSVFKAAKIKIAAFEIESLALVRSLAPRADGAPTLIVDIGAYATNIIVSEGDIMRFGGETDYGGVHLSHALSRGLGVSVFRAEELKRRRGLIGSGGEIELSTSMLPFLDVIIQEVRHVKASYERRYGKVPGQAIFAGGGSNLLGLEKYIERELGVKAVFPPKLSGLSYIPEIEPISGPLTRSLGVAIGLAKKYFSDVA